MEIQYYEHTCLCGCGGKIRVTKWHKYDGIPNYIYGHYGKNKTFAEGHRQKIRLALKGKKKSEEHKRSISLASKGISRNKGKKRTDEQRKNISKSKKGENHPNYGKHLSEVTRKKQSETRKKLLKYGVIKDTKLENNSNWQGGKSFEIYPKEFKQIKQQILKRDNYTCQNPDCDFENKKLMVHHIDYDKNNNNPENLTTLCNSCHSKTIGKNKREFFIKFYQNIMWGKLNVIQDQKEKIRPT